MNAIPAAAKVELRKALALGRLIKAAKALLEENTETATASYTTVDENHWKMEDPEHFKLCRELKNAIREAESASKPGVSRGEG